MEGEVWCGKCRKGSGDHENEEIVQCDCCDITFFGTCWESRRAGKGARMIRCQICKRTQLRLEEMVEGWPKMQKEWGQWKEEMSKEVKEMVEGWPKMQKEWGQWKEEMSKEVKEIKKVVEERALRERDLGRDELIRNWAEPPGESRDETETIGAEEAHEEVLEEEAQGVPPTRENEVVVVERRTGSKEGQLGVAQVEIGKVGVAGPSNRRQEANSKLTPIRFMGKRSKLSNFYPCQIEMEGRWFRLLEAAYQWRKAMFMGEEQKAEEIRQCEEARETKWKANSMFRKAKRGRWGEERMARFERWNDNRVQVMREVLRAKAMGCEEYVQELRESKGRTLMEVVPGDDFWGIASGDGHNWLGRLHMELREELEEGQVVNRTGHWKEREQARESSEGGLGGGKRSVELQGEPAKRG